MLVLNRHCFAVIALLCVGACESGAERQSEAPVVKGTRLENVVVDYVKDGDSFTAFYAGRKIEVRLFGIDSPEKDQPYAKESRLAAVKLLGNSKVYLVVKDRDRYQRVVAEVFLKNQGVSVNLQLVEQGAAWVYRKYSDAPWFISAEERARKSRVGLWSLPESERIEPWTWRKNNKK